jgi:hypothetical protein
MRICFFAPWLQLDVHPLDQRVKWTQRIRRHDSTSPKETRLDHARPRPAIPEKSALNRRRAV